MHLLLWPITGTLECGTGLLSVNGMSNDESMYVDKDTNGDGDDDDWDNVDNNNKANETFLRVWSISGDWLYFFTLQSMYFDYVLWK